MGANLQSQCGLMYSYNLFLNTLYSLHNHLCCPIVTVEAITVVGLCTRKWQWLGRQNMPPSRWRGEGWDEVAANQIMMGQDN
jgi:hypothetical protein